MCNKQKQRGTDRTYSIVLARAHTAVYTSHVMLQVMLNFEVAQHRQYKYTGSPPRSQFSKHAPPVKSRPHTAAVLWCRVNTRDVQESKLEPTKTAAVAKHTRHFFQEIRSCRVFHAACERRVPKKKSPNDNSTKVVLDGFETKHVTGKLPV